jgi:hypothetical protein
MRGATPPLPVMPEWRGSMLSTGINFTATFTLTKVLKRNFNNGTHRLRVRNSKYIKLAAKNLADLYSGEVSYLYLNDSRLRTRVHLPSQALYAFIA